jgi:acyl dehydratase
MRYFEDFTPGTSGRHGPVEVEAEAIRAFAEEFDPNPIHLDPAAAGAGLMDGPSASGWHTCCLLMRMLCDSFLLESAGLGSPGIDEVRWAAPVRPGDELSLTWTVTEARQFRSRPEMGLVRFEFVLTNQRGAEVMRMTNPVMFAVRGAGEARP